TCALPISDPGADRALDQSPQIREKGLHPAEAARREGRASPPRQGRRQADENVRQARDLYWRAGRGAVQAGPLPLLRIYNSGLEIPIELRSRCPVIPEPERSEGARNP